MMVDVPGAVAFFHTACCDGHWELVVLEDGSRRLYCCECGEPGPFVRVVVPDV